jgi:ribonuclease BN (tRNA processing enzyme)
VQGWLLGSGGWIPSEQRETLCVLLREGDDGLLLDAGTGLRRLVSEPELLDGLDTLDVVLTHFHLDHICGLAYVPALPLTPTIWAPGRWLYGQPSADLLAPLRTAPISPSDASELGEVRELEPGAQAVGRFTVKTRAQELHWAPTAGIRVGDEIALITDTAYDPDSAAFAQDVTHLLHEAWSGSANPVSQAGDSTAAEAGMVARAARAQHLTLVHISPLLADESDLLEDARRHCPGARLGRDRQPLELARPSASIEG